MVANDSNNPYYSFFHKSSIMKYLTILLTLLPLFAMAQDDDFFLDQEYTLAADGTIDLSCDDAEVRITGSDRATAHVVISRKVTAKGLVKGDQEFSVEVSEQDGDLIIREKQTGSRSVSLGYIDEEYTIDIEAPQGASLQVRSDDGNVTVQRMAGAIAIQNDDGDLTLQSCESEAFDLRVDDGDIDMDQGQGELRVHIDDGDISIRQGNFSSVDVSADDGDISLATSLSDQGKYQVSLSDGEIDLQVTEGGGAFDIRHDDTEIDSSGKFTLIKSNDDRTQLTLPDGSAQIDLHVDDGHVSLSAQ